MPYFMALLMSTVSAYLENRQTDGFLWVVHQTGDTCYEDEFSLPVHTDDLRMTVIVKAGYEYDHKQWEYDFAEFYELRQLEALAS